MYVLLFIIISANKNQVNSPKAFQERVMLQRMHDEIRRDMILLGRKSIKELNNLR